MVPTCARDGCPFCRSALAAAGSEAVAEKSCPRCGADLWVLVLSSGPWFFVRRPDQTIAEFLFALAGSKLGMSVHDISSILRSADSLDTVEILEELGAAAGLLGHRTGD